MFTISFHQVLELAVIDRTGKNQAIFGAGGGDVKQAHALEFFPPAITLV